jgi:putative flippase GtrA
VTADTPFHQRLLDRLAAPIGGRVVLGQLIRFGIAGGLSSVVYAAVYAPLTAYVFPGSRAVFAVPFAFAVAVTFGFFAHSRWSFRGHGHRDQGGVQHAKFVIVQALGLSLNAVVTWVGTALLHLHPLVPLVPAIFLAAVVTFILQRAWVFGAGEKGRKG